MNRLQLSNQLQNQCNNIEIAFAGADMTLIVHFHVWPEIRPLGFKGLKEPVSRLKSHNNSRSEGTTSDPNGIFPEMHRSMAA